MQVVKAVRLSDVNGHCGHVALRPTLPRATPPQGLHRSCSSVSMHSVVTFRLYMRSEVLEELDLSWCRGVSGPAVGLLADSCPNLRKLRLFGCSQVCIRDPACLAAACMQHEPGWAVPRCSSVWQAAQAGWGYQQAQLTQGQTLESPWWWRNISASVIGKMLWAASGARMGRSSCSKHVCNSTICVGSNCEGSDACGDGCASALSPRQFSYTTHGSICHAELRHILHLQQRLSRSSVLCDLPFPQPICRV